MEGNRNGGLLQSLLFSGGNSGGGGGGVLICHIDAQTGALDKTWEEIYSAPFAVIKEMPDSGAANWICIIGTEIVPTEVEQETVDVYTVYIASYDKQGAMRPMPLVTDSPDGFPVAQQP